ncbi:MAG: hypothetical protein EXR72_16355 [Myxococcales bacterium]|nr:hypothetical protein [Myxococcales bacterium]
MKRAIRAGWLASSVAVAIGSGCGRGTDSEFVDAVPNAQAVTIAVPAGGMKAGTSEEGLGRSDEALLGTISEYYQITYGVSTGVNAAALGMIGLVHTIVHQPSTRATATSRTWGPWTPGGLDPLTYRVVVTKLAAGQFSFSIEGRARASKSDGDYLPFLDGMANRGLTAGTGKGTMTLHFDNARKLRPESCEQGTIAFAFDNTQAAATLDVMFHAFANRNPQNKLCKDETPTEAVYHYDRTEGGAGNFVFSFRSNIHKAIEAKPALEEVSIRSRWQATGEGRSDFRIGGTEVAADLAKAGLKETAVTASQCWDGSFKTVYETSAPSQVGLIATAGISDKCAFPAAIFPN